MHEEQQTYQKAIDHRLSGLEGSPCLARRIIMSEKGEQPQMKKFTVSLAMGIAIMVLTLSVAVAAGSLLGWSDFFGTQYGTVVPEAGQKIMDEVTNKYSYTLGDVTFNVQELLCDGHIMLASTQASIAEDSSALLCMEPGDAIDANGENGAKMAKMLNVEPGTTWLDAAKQLDRKLYAVRAVLEVPADIDGGEAMEDALWNEEDGSITYFSLSALGGKATGETADVQMFLRVTEFDPATGEEKNRLTAREPLIVNLEPPIAEHTYAIMDETIADGYRVESIQAELTPAGLYLYTTLIAPEGTAVDDVYARDEAGFPVWLDADGKEFPAGISLSSSVDTDHLPTVVYTQMISVDAIPAMMTLRIGESCELTLTR